MSSINIGTWKTNIDNSILLHYTSKLSSDTYLLNGQSTNSNFLEKYLYNIASFHIKNNNIGEDKIIEFCLYKPSNKLTVDINKTKQSPLFSIITCLYQQTGQSTPLVFTDIDIESYKYKDIPDKNSFTIYLPNENTHIIFDSSKYYGFLYNTVETCDTVFIKINIWDKSTTTNLYINECVDPHEYSEINIIDNNNRVSDTIIDDTFMNNLLYGFQNLSPVKIEKIIEKYKNTPTNMMTIKNVINTNVDYVSLAEMYGNIADDIIPFYNDSYSILPTNRFNNNKIVEKILSKDVCYWIINESENNTWTDSQYINYSHYLNIEKMPSILNFILFSSNYWLTNIRQIYNIEKMDINIKDIFITKFTNTKNQINSFNKDGSFLTLNIQLNDNIDYIGGYTQFDNMENTDKILLKQGDMLVYNGQKLKLNGIINNGIKYVLVLLLDIKR